MRCALRAQAAHRAARAAGWPRLPEFRTGIHLGTVVVEAGLRGPRAPGDIGDIQGLQVDTAARVMDLARGGQILCSRSVFDDARQAMKGGEIEGVGALAWIVVLSRWDLSYAYPFLALNFVLIALVSRLVLGESIPLIRWAGIAFICAGIVLISRSGAS